MAASPERTGNGNRQLQQPGSVREGAVHAGARRSDVVRDMVRADRAAHPERDGTDHHAGTTASADAVESLRRSLRDLKHDVRMLKVDLDKQSQVLDHIASLLAGRSDDRSRRSDDRPRRA